MRKGKLRHSILCDTGSTLLTAGTVPILHKQAVMRVGLGEGIEKPDSLGLCFEIMLPNYHFFKTLKFLFSINPREPLTDCLKDVDLIPPFNRMLLEVTFGKLYSWAIQNVRNILIDANSRFKELGEYLIGLCCKSPSKYLFCCLHCVLVRCNLLEFYYGI